jgi:hypothetical protein
MALTPADEAAIAAVNAGYPAAAARIRANEDLSAAGRRRALAQARTAVKAKTSRISDAAWSGAELAGRDARHRAFGLRSADPAAIVAFRDAQDRVAQCKTPAEARELAARAERYGDTGMATAVAAVAMERMGSGAPDADSWGGLLGDWLSQHPEREADIRELGDALDATSDKARLYDSAWLYLPPDPELAGMTDSQIAALAAAPAPDDAADAA